MDIFSYQVVGDTTPLVATVISGLQYDDTTDPTNIAQVLQDWSATGAGYSNNLEPLDGGVHRGVAGTLDALLFYEQNALDPTQVATVWVGGNAIPANGLPFLYTTHNKNYAIFTRNVPKEPGTYICTMVFKPVTGKTPIVRKWMEIIT
jgi:hypothetical protein